jgi:hypothetical protein
MDRKCECHIAETIDGVAKIRHVLEGTVSILVRCDLCREREEVGREGGKIIRDCLWFLGNGYINSGNLQDRLIDWIKKAHELGMLGEPNA